MKCPKCRSALVEVADLGVSIIWKCPKLARRIDPMREYENLLELPDPHFVLRLDKEPTKHDDH